MTFISLQPLTTCDSVSGRPRLGDDGFRWEDRSMDRWIQETFGTFGVQLVIAYYSWHCLQLIIFWRNRRFLGLQEVSSSFAQSVLEGLNVLTKKFLVKKQSKSTPCQRGRKGRFFWYLWFSLKDMSMSITTNYF